MAKGDDHQNQQYCSKSDTNAWQIGQPTKQGQRNDIKAACQAIKEGKSMKFLCENYEIIEISLRLSKDHRRTYLLQTKGRLVGWISTTTQCHYRRLLWMDKIRRTS